MRIPNEAKIAGPCEEFVKIGETKIHCTRGSYHKTHSAIVKPPVAQGNFKQLFAGTTGLYVEWQDGSWHGAARSEAS